jgi:UDP-N-acetylglucosamine--N-acetylmuramyl-(pentapeptide) pyrophosphoryl-undecaprenol N-acetylglucosamine transferase
VVSFIDDMPGAYDWADVVISRAGASSVAEIAAVNRPAIFVPYPFQQGTHQSDNANVLVSKRKALLVEQHQPEFFSRLKEAVEKILTPSVFREMKEAPFELPATQPAVAIATGIFELIEAK